MFVIEAGSVVQWPQTFADESLIREDDINAEITDQLAKAENARQNKQASEIKKYCEEALTCCICFNLVTDPQDCLKCDTTLCGRCCEQLRARNTGCPQRCNKGFKPGHKLVRQMLN